MGSGSFSRSNLRRVCGGNKVYDRGTPLFRFPNGHGLDGLNRNFAAVSSRGGEEPSYFVSNAIAGKGTRSI